GDDQPVARQHRAGKPRLHGPEPGRIRIAQAVQQRPAGETVGAEPVQDRPLETASRRECRVRVQRVAVTREPVEQSLLGPRLVLDAKLRLALRPLPVTGGATVAAKASLTSDEGSGPRGDEGLAG